MERPNISRCLGRLGSTAPAAFASLLLAFADTSPVTVTVLVVGVWLWLATAVIFGMVRTAIAVVLGISAEAREP